MRPLASDPHASEENNTAGASRDHVISEDPKSGLIFGAYIEILKSACENVSPVNRYK